MEFNDKLLIKNTKKGLSDMSHMINVVFVFGEYLNLDKESGTIGKLKLNGMLMYNMTWQVQMKVVDKRTEEVVLPSVWNKIVERLKKNNPHYEPTIDEIEHNAKGYEKCYRPFYTTIDNLPSHLTPCRFASMSVPKGMCTIGHFSSGSMNCTGGRNPTMGIFSVIGYASDIENIKDENGEQMFSVRGIKMYPRNFVRSFKLPFRVQLNKLKGWEYNPKNYPAAISDRFIPGNSVQIFDTGAVNIAGNEDDSVVKKALKDIEELCISMGAAVYGNSVSLKRGMVERTIELAMNENSNQYIEEKIKEIKEKEHIKEKELFTNDLLMQLERKKRRIIIEKK